MDNRDPRKKYRYDKRGRRITSSSTRSKRQQASTAPKPTSSKTRATTKGTSKKVTTGKGESVLEKFERIKRANKNLRSASGAQGPKTPPVQGPYQRATKGLLGSRGGPNKQKVPTPGTKAKPASSNIRRTGNLPKPKLAVKKGGMGRNNLRTMGVTALAAALNTGSLRNPVSKAKAKEAAEILAKKEKPKKPTKPSQSAADKARQAKKQAATEKEIARRSKKKGFSAKAFDNAFATARKAGKKEFTWRGKKYNTKLA